MSAEKPSDVQEEAARALREALTAVYVSVDDTGTMRDIQADIQRAVRAAFEAGTEYGKGQVYWPTADGPMPLPPWLPEPTK